jgi:hypothetical protein
VRDFVKSEGPGRHHPVGPSKISRFWNRLAGHGITRDARNVSAENAEIGKLAVGEKAELTARLVIAVPPLDTVFEEVEHGLSPME